MKFVALFSFLLVTFLWGTFYSVTKEALGRIDPFLFAFLETSVTLPFSFLLIILHRKKISYDLLKRGFILGALLGINLLTAALALNYTTATNTAFFPSICGIAVAFYAWAFQKQKVTLITWIAGILSALGTLLLILENFNITTRYWQGDILALIAPLFYAAYIFRLDYDTKNREIALWPLLGIELIVMNLVCGLGLLCFGDWSNVHHFITKDYAIILYVGLATTFLPAVISIFLQRYLSPISVAFIFILEPIWGAIIAAFYLGEKLSLRGYFGGILIVTASFLNTLDNLRSNPVKGRLEQH